MWAAVALDVGSRLWLATAVACRRDGLLVHLLLRRTLATLAGHAFLLSVDDPPHMDALFRLPTPRPHHLNSRPHNHGSVKLYRIWYSYTKPWPTLKTTLKSGVTTVPCGCTPHFEMRRILKYRDGPGLTIEIPVPPLCLQEAIKTLLTIRRYHHVRLNASLCLPSESCRSLRSPTRRLFLEGGVTEAHT